ncbi:MAG: hypothetical protein A2X49_02280 [Lentisphaerae bacterium GWF2_52_8]|nr:MAG: hypothetical protein A2X49_02280 [Lentisphaerae bacterium GWF2_52_8]
MKNIFAKSSFLLIASITFLFTGCGYHMGSLMHPQIKTIAIAPVTNNTMEYNLSAYMRQALSEEFCRDASLKVKSQEQADCILYCKVTKVKNTSTGMEDSTDNEITYRPAEWSIELTVEFTVVIPGRPEPLITTREVTQAATYQVMNDQVTARTNGLKQACRSVSEDVVEFTTEAW